MTAAEVDDPGEPFVGDGSTVALPVSPDMLGLIRTGDETLQLHELTDYEEFSTVVFGVDADVSMMTQSRVAFSYGQSQPVPGAPAGQWATRTDTSLPRAGSYGLPQGWAGYVFGWRATAHGPAAVLKSDAFAAWTESTVALFTSNHRQYVKLPLVELLRAPKPVAGAVMPPEISALRQGQISIPVKLWEGLPFEVVISPDKLQPCDALRRELILAAGIDERHKMLLTRLECIGGSAVAAVVQELRPQPIQIRVFLRGWWKRTVV